MRRCSVASWRADPIPPPDALSEATAHDAPAPTTERPKVEVDAQLALGDNPSDAEAVALVLKLYPELQDWPLEELKKLAPSIIEQHAERERADES